MALEMEMADGDFAAYFLTKEFIGYDRWFEFDLPAGQLQFLAIELIYRGIFGTFFYEFSNFLIFRIGERAGSFRLAPLT